MSFTVHYLVPLITGLMFVGIIYSLEHLSK